MKTTKTHAASNNMLGGILLLSLLSTAVISMNFVAFSDLYTAFESQWMNFTGWMSGFMAQPVPAHW
ncbi:MAG: hypothetical protein KA138_06935 [Saprospiraceae bacterium]|nr:hypothetical protein [Saprospiraceae bacterium]